MGTCPTVCATGFVPIVVLDRRQRLVTRPLGSADAIDGPVRVTDDRVHTLLERRPFRVADVCARTRSFAERNVFPILARSPVPEVGTKARSATPGRHGAGNNEKHWAQHTMTPLQTDSLKQGLERAHSLRTDRVEKPCGLCTQSVRSVAG
jgi:hypothetical protein